MQILEQEFGNEPSARDETLGRSELDIILEAWDRATAKLQYTHEVLRDEVRRLTDELEIKNRELARKNRLADLGQMASHVAHEVRNGLAPVKLYLGLLARRIRRDHQDYEIMEKTERGIALLETTVTDLLHFAADRDPVRSTFSPRDLYAEIADMLAPQLAAQRIQVHISGPNSDCLCADRDMLRRAVFNLVINAIDAMPEGGTLRLFSTDDEDQVQLSVVDSGSGISEVVAHRVFEPFFTTKSHGTGLGLAIVFRIAELHGGEVVATNAAEQGACFTLILPKLIQEV